FVKLYSEIDGRFLHGLLRNVLVVALNGPRHRSEPAEGKAAKFAKFRRFPMLLRRACPCGLRRSFLRPAEAISRWKAERSGPHLVGTSVSYANDILERIAGFPQNLVFYGGTRPIQPHRLGQPQSNCMNKFYKGPGLSVAI